MTLKTSHFAVAPSGYLLLDTVPTVLALPAVNVLAIARAAEWDAELPLSFSILMPIYFAAQEPARVLRIGCGVQSIVALISGKIRVEYLHADALLAMPTLNHWGFEFFSEVVLADGKPSALVVNVDALFRAHRELDK